MYDCFLPTLWRSAPTSRAKRKRTLVCVQNTPTQNSFWQWWLFFRLSSALSLTLCLPLSNIFQRLYWLEKPVKPSSYPSLSYIPSYFMLATFRTVNAIVQVHQLKMSIFYPWFKFLVNFYFLAPSYRRIKRPTGIYANRIQIFNGEFITCSTEVARLAFYTKITFKRSWLGFFIIRCSQLTSLKQNIFRKTFRQMYLWPHQLRFL